MVICLFPRTGNIFLGSCNCGEKQYSHELADHRGP